MREKNGSGGKLLNLPESQGYLAIHAAHFIPVTAASDGPYSYTAWLSYYGRHNVHLHLYIVIFFFICAILIDFKITAALLSIYVLNNFFRALQSDFLALLQERMSR